MELIIFLKNEEFEKVQNVRFKMNFFTVFLISSINHKKENEH